MPPDHARFETWVEAAFERWLRELRWSEIARGLGALSSDYVQRRKRLNADDVLEGRGKRAAFALYYAPRHYVLTREVLQALGTDGLVAPRPIIDIGCGLGVAGAAWAALFDTAPEVTGVDPHAWALGEARIAYRDLGIPARTVRAPIERFRWPASPAHVVAAFAVNELEPAARDALLATLARRMAMGSAVLVVEPLAGRITPWWSAWQKEFAASGGRADEWRFDAALPGRVAELGHSAGLDPRELGCRTLWVAPPSQQSQTGPA